MAIIIQIKMPSSGNTLPIAGNLESHELAVLTGNKQLFTKDNSGNIKRVIGDVGPTGPTGPTGAPGAPGPPGPPGAPC